MQYGIGGRHVQFDPVGIVNETLGRVVIVVVDGGQVLRVTPRIDLVQGDGAPPVAARIHILHRIVVEVISRVVEERIVPDHAGRRGLEIDTDASVGRDLVTRDRRNQGIPAAETVVIALDAVARVTVDPVVADGRLQPGVIVANL